MAGMIRWGQLVVVGADGSRQVVPLAGEGPPDLAVVEGLARLQLLTRRAGGRMWLEDVSPALAELLDLAGLRAAVTGPDGPPGNEPYAGR
jgi:hypothetical protein